MPDTLGTQPASRPDGRERDGGAGEDERGPGLDAEQHRLRHP